MDTILKEHNSLVESVRYVMKYAVYIRVVLKTRESLLTYQCIATNWLKNNNLQEGLLYSAENMYIFLHNLLY
jgi:hypothetical protein